MINRYHQRGLGMFGWMFVIGFVGMCFKIGFALFPVYMNQWKLDKAVTKVALSAPATAAPSDIRRLLQPSWDIDDIEAVSPADIKVKKTATGRALGYSYEHRVPVIANVSLVVDFTKDIPMSAGGGSMGQVP